MSLGSLGNLQKDRSVQRSLPIIAVLALFLPALKAQAHTWIDSTGSFSVQAEYLDYQDGKARLKRADNQKIISVPMDRFSRSDRNLIQNLQRHVRAGDKVVTLHLTSVKLGGKVLATVDAGVELVVAEVRKPWIGVVVQKEGRQITGWIPIIEVSRTASGGSLDDVRPVAVPAIKVVSRGVEHTSEADFEQQVLKADVPVLVDFYAEWCGPCRALGPVLEELAAEVAGVKIVKVDFDHNRSLAARYGVQSLPSLLVFKSGQVRDRQVGVAAKARLKSMLEL